MASSLVEKGRPNRITVEFEIQTGQIKSRGTLSISLRNFFRHDSDGKKVSDLLSLIQSLATSQQLQPESHLSEINIELNYGIGTLAEIIRLIRER